MITSNERQSVGNGYLSVGEFYGLSTDTKPTNTANGSTFFEMDTGKMYRYNFAAHTWTQTTHYGNLGGFGPAPSGGGSSGGGGVLECTIDENGTLNHTWQEIADAPSAVVRIPIYDDGDLVRVMWAPIVTCTISPALDEGFEYNVFICMFGEAENESITYELQGFKAIATSPTDYPVMDEGGSSGDDTQQA